MNERPSPPQRHTTSVALRRPLRRYSMEGAPVVGESLRHTSDHERRQRMATRAIEEGRLLRVWRCLKATGLEPILIKGWSTARLYLDPDQRSLGDIDLCFSPEQLDRALALRRQSGGDFVHTDYHLGVSDLPDRTWTEIYARTKVVRWQGVEIRVLSAEDHLRLTCRHFARHGANARRMLEDVAEILKTLPNDFDWHECLRGDEADTRWVLTTLALAVQLMGAFIPDAQIRERATCPAFIVETVSNIWRAGRLKRPLRYYLTRPRESAMALRYRWLNPVRAAFHTRTLPRTRVGLAIVVFRFLMLRRVSTLITNPLRRVILGRGRRYRPEMHQDW